MDDFGDGATGRGGDRGVNNKVLRELGGVACRVPQVDIVAGVSKRDNGLVHGVPVAFEKENCFVNVVPVIKGNVTVGRFGSPDIRWDFNDEEGGQGGVRSGGKAGTGCVDGIVSAGGVNRADKVTLGVVISSSGEDRLERCRARGRCGVVESKGGDTVSAVCGCGVKKAAGG